MEIVSVIVAVLALVLSAYTFILTYKRDKVRDTIKAYTDLQSFLYHYYEYSDGEIETFVDDWESEEYKSLSNSLAQVEMFATGVKQGIYDYNVVFKLAHGFLDGTLRDRLEYMLDMKTEKHPELYRNTRWLLKKMDKTPIR